MLVTEVKVWLVYLLFLAPGKIGIKMRAKYISSRARSLGKDLVVEPGAQFMGLENMSLGSGCLVRKNCSFAAHSGGKIDIADNVGFNMNTAVLAADGGHISIGRDTIVAQNVVIRAADHNHSDPHVPIRFQGHVGGMISIGQGSWIGANVVITRNVRIGEYCIIGAGSVVTKDVPDYSIAAGVPARLIRDRRSV